MNHDWTEIHYAERSDSTIEWCKVCGAWRELCPGKTVRGEIVRSSATPCHASKAQRYAEERADPRQERHA